MLISVSIIKLYLSGCNYCQFTLMHMPLNLDSAPAQVLTSHASAYFNAVKKEQLDNALLRL